MGKLSPQQVKVPPVDDLLSELSKVVPPKLTVRVLDVPQTPFYMDRERYEYEMRERQREREQHNHCDIHCKCPPCRKGDCRNCTLEQMARAGVPAEEVKRAAAEFRGVVYE